MALIGERNRVANRVQKVLEDANIKLASVASDTLGLSGRSMLEALIASEQDPDRLAGLARGLLKRKALQKDRPEPRNVQRPEAGVIVSIAEVGGRHHRYERRAA